MKLEPFALERYFAEYEFTTPYLLCASDCESMTIAELLALEPGAQQAFCSLGLGYTESRGHPALRAAISSLYDGISADSVLVHAGAEEAIFNFMNVVVSSGDHVVVHAPCYQSLTEVARGAGATVTEWRASPERSWTLDLDDLERQLTDRTRLVVVNFPHNPTGYLPSRSFVNALCAMADRRGFLIFCDEVYRGLEYDPADRLPALAELTDRAVSLGVMSKTYGLAGLRIGWLVSRDPTLLERLATFKDYTTICNSAPSEFLAEIALRHHESLAGRNRGIIRENLVPLNRFFAEQEGRFRWQAPRAGPIAFPEYLGGSVVSFCKKLAATAGVLLLPGAVYGVDTGAFRIGFGRSNAPEALDRLSAYLNDQDNAGEE
jgi:aspartate/methionine/tyrosine aminotransferase